jgi:autotransporter-associated beta strand protein
LACAAHARTLYWDPGLTPATPTGGSGVWDATAANWSDLTNAVVWTNADAVFQGAPGVVSLAFTNSAASLQVGTDGYIISGGRIRGNVSLLVNSGLTATVAIGHGVDGDNKQFTKLGAGTLIWAGTTADQWERHVIAAGTLKLGRSDPFAFQNSLTISNGAVLDLNGYTINSHSGGAGDLNSIWGPGTVLNNGTANCVLAICANSVNSTFTFDGSIVDGARRIALQLDRTTMTLTGTNNTYSGDTSFTYNNAGDGLRAGAVNAFSPRSTIVMGNYNSTVTVDLNGYDQTIGGLSGETGGSVFQVLNNGAAPATLTICNNSTNQTCGGAKGAIRDGTNALAVVKDGIYTLTLTGTNTYSGGTLLRSGTLQANVSGALGARDVTVSPTGSLYIATGVTNAIGDSARLLLLRAGTNYAAVWIGTGNVERVQSLWLDGVKQPQGLTFGGAASPALVVNTNYFQGVGVIQTEPGLTSGTLLQVR